MLPKLADRAHSRQTPTAPAGQLQAVSEVNSRPMRLS
jgi:hypothetical protein